MKKTDNFGSAPDPYVQVVFNQGLKDRKTKTVKNSVSPTWNEEFGWEISHDKVSELTASLRVFDDDKLSKDDPLGEVVIPLWQVDFASGATEEIKPLQPISKVLKVTAKIFYTTFPFLATCQVTETIEAEAQFRIFLLFGRREEKVQDLLWSTEVQSGA